MLHWFTRNSDMQKSKVLETSEFQHLVEITKREKRIHFLKNYFFWGCLISFIHKKIRIKSFEGIFKTKSNLNCFTVEKFLLLVVITVPYSTSDSIF